MSTTPPSSVSTRIETSDITVRYVTVGDYDAVTALLAELGRPPSTPETEPATRAVFADHVADPLTATLIAERGGVAGGVCTLHFRPRLNHATLEAWIPDLIVTETEHGQGIAPLLFDAAVTAARERGCHNLTLESGYQRQRAHRFYEREGMTDRGKYFSMAL